MVKKVIEPGNSQQSVTENTSADTSDGKKSTNEEVVSNSTIDFREFSI